MRDTQKHQRLTKYTWLESVREAVWQMQQPDDILGVFGIIQEMLSQRGISYQALRVNVIDPPAERVVGRYMMGVHSDSRGKWTFRDEMGPGTRSGIIVDFWRAGREVYRPNLAEQDPYGERPWASRHQPSILSVLDIPISHGTLSINSTESDAFSEGSIADLQALGAVVSDGFRRLEDIRRLEQRNQELRAEISDRKHAEEALRESETKYQTLIDVLQGVVIAQANPLRLVFANPAMGSIFGYDADELTRMGPDELALLVWEGDRQRFFDSFQLRLDGQNMSPGGDYRLICRDGSVRWAATQSSAIEFSGQPATLTSFVDITERKQAEEATQVNLSVQQVRNEILLMVDEDGWGGVLQRLEQELHGLIECENCGINILDTTNDIQIDYSMTGGGLQCERVEGIPSVLRQVQETGKPLYRRNRGEIDQWENSLSRAEIRSVVDVPFPGGTLAINSGAEDAFAERDLQILSQFAQVVAEGVQRLEGITQRKQMEEEIRRAHSVESLGLLAGGIAHDFNNVLTGVAGNLDLLAQLLDRDSIEYEITEDAQRAASRTKDLTQQLMTFSKGGAPVKETASIEELIRETTAMSLHGANTRPRFVFCEDLSSVNMDVGQIGQVVQNLAINADQAMPTGGVLEISAENISISDGDSLPLRAGEYVKVSVEDQGVGIPESLLSQIFDPYFSTKETGQGLGLSICHSVIHKHRGHMAVSSVVGQGTTFGFYLPASEKQAIATVEPEAAIPAGSGRILYMDDVEVILRTVGRTLRLLGYDVESALDGDEAIGKYSSALTAGKPYDVVVMDLTIPGGMGGKEAIGKLLEVDPHAQVLVSSGYSHDPVMADYADYGFVGSVVKPIDVGELADSICRVLKARE
jgi:PAS domain S-box-containing protein